MIRPLFDCLALAAEIHAASARFASMRQAAAAAGVDPATFSRARRGWPTLSHENWLRLRAWLDSLHQEQAA